MSGRFEVLAILAVARYLSSCDGWEWNTNPNIRIRRRQDRYIARAKECVRMAVDLTKSANEHKLLVPDGAHEQ